MKTLDALIEDISEDANDAPWFEHYVGQLKAVRTEMDAAAEAIAGLLDGHDMADAAEGWLERNGYCHEGK